MALAEPFVIHHVAGRYLIFETATLKHLREVHHMCGVLVGTLAQITQQNVFLGLPLQLMPEEAAYLVDHGHAVLVDDTRVHRETIARLTPESVEAYKTARLHEQARKEMLLRRQQAQKKREALEKRGLTHLLEKLTMEESETASLDSVASQTGRTMSVHVDTVSDAVIFDPVRSSDHETQMTAIDLPRYELFAHLHERGYYMTPGLRFGAQFVAYPGDPLRFHSHFIASGHAWTEEVDVMDIVGGGRLGTGVKKAWLIGGKSPDDGEVKCFTVEWAGM